jgi:hypothetical protein
VQHNRSSMTTLLNVSFDGVIYKTTNVRFMPSIDGATNLPDYYPKCLIHNTNTIKVAGRVTARNFLVKLKGQFSISNMEIQAESNQGDR